MKFHFKRLLSAIAALAITATCISTFTISNTMLIASADENVAELGTVVSNTTKVYDNDTDKHKLSNLKDGSPTTSWQAHNDDKKEGLWVGIEFDVPIQATQVKLLGSGFAASANNSDKILDDSYVISYNNGSEEITVDSTLISKDGNYLVTTFPSATELYSIKYTFNKFDKSAPYLYEIEVYGTVSQINEYKANINALLDQISTLNEIDYTAQSWQTLQEAITTAEAALESTAEATVKEAYEALYNAYNNREYDESYELRNQLATLLPQAKTTAQKLAMYTEETGAALTSAIAAAEALQSSTDVTALTNAINALSSAISGVTFVTAENGFVGNLAPDYATPYDNGGEIYGDGYSLSALIDENLDVGISRWQYKSNATPIYVGLSFPIPVNVASVRILATSVTPTASGDGLTTDGLTITCTGADGATFDIASSNWVVEDERWLIFSFDELTAITDIRYNITKCGNWAPRIGEIEVYGVLTVDSAVLKEAVANANAVIRYRYTAESLALLDAELAKVEAATDAAEQAALAEAINNAIANLVKDNLALNKTQITATGDNVGWGNAVPNMNDGAYNTRWQSGSGSNTIEEYAGVNFGASITFDTLEIYYETSRPSSEYIQYSQDGITWNDVSNPVITGSLAETVNVDGQDAYYRCYTFDAVKAEYVRIRLIGAYDNWNYNMSIYEFEAYNSTKTELSEDTAIHYNVATAGAQERDSITLSGGKDMRFVNYIDVDFWAENADNVTAIGTLMARADQLAAAGLDGTALTLDFSNANVTVKNVYAVYLNDSIAATENYYQFYSTITGISSENYGREYVGVAYCKVGDTVYYGLPVTRCVNDGIN